VSYRGVHHLGFAVTDLDEAVSTYGRLFGATLEHRDAVGDQGVEAASVFVGDSHVAYEVADVAAELARLADAGVELIDETPRHGLFGLEVAFVHPDSVHGVLTEVVSAG
jgi:methylmalonyl-CoA/ethylmalonyl-CoA epimerase